MINVLHMSPWPLGGSTSYVVNLAKTFEAAEVPYRVVRLAKRTESRKRQIGKYGVWYQNVSFESAVKGSGTWLLASAPTDKTLAEQCCELVHSSRGSFVFHDPNEFKLFPHWSITDRERVICIRETGLDSMPYGEFIPHPYVRVCENYLGKRTKHAVSIARTSAVKHSDWILAANQSLPNKKRVDLRGDINRMWWRFSVAEKHPEWPLPEKAGFPRIHGEAANICKPYDLMVDLTIFANDGGGTQYSLLEAMDAGAIPVMTKTWCAYRGPAKGLGYQVEDSSDLEVLLNSKLDDVELRRVVNYDYLDRIHRPAKISKLYKAHLGV